jgi:hypothetical protein
MDVVPGPEGVLRDLRHWEIKPDRKDVTNEQHQLIHDVIESNMLFRVPEVRMRSPACYLVEEMDLRYLRVLLLVTPRLGLNDNDPHYVFKCQTSPRQMAL